MTLPDLIRKSKPTLISIFVVILCYAFKRWGQAHFFDTPPLVEKYPFFPYYPVVLLMGYLYGTRTGLFIAVISAILIVSTHPNQIDDWRITMPFYIVSCILGLWVIMSLKKARENEQSHRRAQANFMAMLAHEIKNPLSTLEASAYSLSLMANSEAAGKSIRNHRMALDDISRIVDRLLELDAIENSKINVFNERFEIKQFLMDIIESASSPERIKMSCPIERTIRTDPILTRRILMNLVDNALKYGEPTTPIKLAAIPERRLGRLGIAFRCINAPGSSGHPDPAELFSKYYRAPTATGVSGAGVGLWLCKQFVEAMSGVIQLDVRDHQISFYVWIPDLS